MKKLNYLIIISFIFTVNSSFAQEYYPDTIFVNFENKANICIANKNNSKINAIENIQETFVNFHHDLELIKSTIPDSLKYLNIRYIIELTDENKIIISPNTNEQQVYYFGENDSFYKYELPKYTIIIPLEKSKLIIQVNDLTVLTELKEKNIAVILNEAANNLGKEARHRIPQNYYFDHDGKNLDTNSKKTKSYHKPMDQIELTGGIGAGLDKHVLVPDLNARIAFTFANKGIYKSRYYAGMQWKYYFDNNITTGKTDMNINPFLHVGYEYNFGKSPEDSRWYGLEVGYLLKERGGHFDSNTIKVALSMKLPQKFTISPEIYIGEKIYPGLRLVYGF